MNKLTSLQRKLVYLGGIILLFIPITLLGLPGTTAPASGMGTAQEDAGGKLTRLRKEYDLGESSLGSVDPASSAMSLVLLGFRGVATSLLWLQAQHEQKTKAWPELRATTESIILLQPHFLKVWDFQGWNLAYNVSVEWDAVADRYYWVKEGIKFLKKGVQRNQKYPQLYWYVADTTGKKIGRSDERVQFRRFFRDDPNKEMYPSGLDAGVNPDGKDNYLVAKEWFERANEVNDTYHNEQHIMARILFRGYPMRAQMDYATALQQEGLFDEVTRHAWEVGFNEWTTIYGMEEFDSPGGMLHMEVTPDEAARMEKGTKEDRELLRWVARYQDMTNYRYWRTRALAELDKNTVEAHRELYEGERAYLRGDFTASRDLLEKGMAKFDTMLKRYPDLLTDDPTIEEGLLGQLNWRAVLLLEDEPVPASYPLKELWDASQNRLPSVEEEFKRRKKTFR